MMKSRLSSLFALLVMFLLISASDQPENKSEKPPEKKITLAVYPIKMAGADKSLEAPLTQILIREISRSAMLTVLEEDMIAEVLKKQGFANSDLCDNTQCQISIGKLTPAQKLVTPELSKLGKKFILDLKVTDIQTGAVDFVASGEKVCTEDDLDQLAAETALELRAKFGEKVERAHPAAQPQSLPATPVLQPYSGAATENQNILGIVVADDLSSLEKMNYMGGVRVKSVSPDSPCKGVLAAGNIITYLNPQGQLSANDPRNQVAPFHISSLNDFRKLVAGIAPGASVGFIFHSGKSLTENGSSANCVIPSQPQYSSAPPSSSSESAGNWNILGLKVKEVPYQLMHFVAVESISPDSPCKDIVKPDYIIFGMNPLGPDLPGNRQTNITKIKDFDALVSQIKPGTTIGMRVCETGYKCNNVTVKILAN